MVKNNKLLLTIFLLMLVFYTIGCTATINEIEKNWKLEQGFSEIYIYKGTGTIGQMTWSGNSGIIFLENTTSSEEKDYIKLYQDDSSYSATQSRTDVTNSYLSEYVGYAFINENKNIKVDIVKSSSWLVIYVDFIS